MFSLLSNEKISLARSFMWICLMTLLLVSIGFGIRSYYFYMRQQRYLDQAYTVRYIIPVSNSKEVLSKELIIELLGFSKKNLPNLYQLNASLLEQRLKKFSVIKKATLTKIHPNTLRVDYELRQPIAYLGAYENTAIDNSGVLFPFKPYFKYTSRPRFYFEKSDKPLVYGEKLPLHLFELATKLDKLAKDKLGNYSSLDVSLAFAPSLGQRQIILVLGSQSQRVILKLHSTQYEKNLDDYIILKKTLLDESRPYPWIIDFRVSSLAFIHSKKE